MYDRFKWNPEIRFERLRFTMPDKPSRFFVGSTIELFGEWVKREWLAEIFGVVKCHPTHTFIFLTKCPQNLVKWSPFPKNCWVGVSAMNNLKFHDALFNLEIVKAGARFVSVEPMLGEIPMNEGKIERMKLSLDWLIIGQQTPVSRKTEPKIDWIREIVQAADTAGIPVFFKDNLKPLLPPEVPTFYTLAEPWNERDPKPTLRQEFPDRSYIKCKGEIGNLRQER